MELYRIVVVLTSAITLPYLVFYAFILLALRNPLYRDRFANAFGVTSLTLGTDRQSRTPARPAPTRGRVVRRHQDLSDKR